MGGSREKVVAPRRADPPPEQKQGSLYCSRVLVGMWLWLACTTSRYSHRRTAPRRCPCVDAAAAAAAAAGCWEMLTTPQCTSNTPSGRR